MLPNISAEAWNIAVEVLGIAGLLSLTFFAIAVIAIALGIYIYTSFAYMSIAKRKKIKPAGLAWIPVVGPALISVRIAKMHWWPILLLLGNFIPLLGLAAIAVYTVFATIWLWKVFEALKRPGWWALLCLIPIVNLVLLGIAAWGK
jgi:hypothetical protein